MLQLGGADGAVVDDDDDEVLLVFAIAVDLGFLGEGLVLGRGLIVRLIDCLSFGGFSNLGALGFLRGTTVEDFLVVEVEGGILEEG